MVSAARITNCETQLGGGEERLVVCLVTYGHRRLEGGTTFPGVLQYCPYAGPLVGAARYGNPPSRSRGFQFVLAQCTKKALGVRPYPVPDADAVTALQRLGAVGQEIALEHDFHSGPKRTLLHSWTDSILGLTERQDLTTPGPTTTPSRRERYHRAILTDQRRDNSEPALNVAELDQCATGRKNQFRVWRKSRHVFSPDRQAIARVEECPIDVAEQGYSRQGISLQ